MWAHVVVVREALQLWTVSVLTSFWLHASPASVCVELCSLRTVNSARIQHTACLHVPEINTILWRTFVLSRSHRVTGFVFVYMG